MTSTNDVSLSLVDSLHSNAKLRANLSVGRANPVAGSTTRYTRFNRTATRIRQGNPYTGTLQPIP